METAISRIVEYVAKVGDTRNIFVETVVYLQGDDLRGLNPYSDLASPVSRLHALVHRSENPVSIKRIVTALRRKLVEHSALNDRYLPTVDGVLAGEALGVG